MKLQVTSMPTSSSLTQGPHKYPQTGPILLARYGDTAADQVGAERVGVASGPITSGVSSQPHCGPFIIALISSTARLAPLAQEVSRRRCARPQKDLNVVGNGPSRT
jgi:hypothetical protein